MTFSFETAQARAADILSIAQQHGAQLKKSGGEYAGPCPVCGGCDRFSVNPQRQLWNCRGCGKGGDVIAFVQHLRGLGFLEAVRDLAGGKGGPVVRAARTPEPSTQAPSTTTMPAAIAMWREGVEPRGSVVEAYLNSRELELEEGVSGDVIRFHPGANAMLALFRGIEDDQPKAISRTFFGKDGVKLGRKFLGPVGGCAIKLDPEEDVLAGLHIGEGIETGLAARQLGLRPAWALGSAGAIAAFPVLAGIEALTLLRERDDANARAADQVTFRWQVEGREVFDAWPNVGKDVNDALKGGQA